jgi:hypothetical protein
MQSTNYLLSFWNASKREPSTVSSFLVYFSTATHLWKYLLYIEPAGESAAAIDGSVLKPAFAIDIRLS